MSHHQTWAETAAAPVLAMLAFVSFALGCSSAETAPPESRPDDAVADRPADTAAEAPPEPPPGEVATVVEVRPSGSGLAVTVRSPDTGCDQYADWWEVLRPDGSLVYRRILAHSHVDEQPFTRSGGPVTAADDESLIVRAHMNPGGYGSQAQQGSLSGGFMQVELEPGFAPELETTPPLPENCAF
ncbi:MAG: hypothetical protein AAGF12_40425 [Myxococcota bacterium]